MFDWDLAGDNGRGATVAIIKDLEKVAPLGLIKNRETPDIVCGRPLVASTF
jgi:hypothetical protein